MTYNYWYNTSLARGNKVYHFQVGLTNQQQEDIEKKFNEPNKKKSQDRLVRKIIENILVDTLTHLKKGQREAVLLLDATNPLSYHFENDGAKGFFLPLQLDQLSDEVKEEINNKTEAAEAIRSNVVIGPMHKIDKTRSFLDQFSIAPPRFTGPFAKINAIMHQFFAAIRALLKTIGEYWRDILGIEDTEMEWNMALLSDLFGFAVDEAPMVHVLEYMSAVLEKREGGKHGEEIVLLSKAVKKAAAIQTLKSHFSQKKQRAFIRTLRKEVRQLPPPEKMLIPVGYWDRALHKMVEMLLEISQKDTAKGTCTVALISQAKEVRDYFDKDETSQESRQSLRREMANVSLNDLLAHLPGLIELQTSPDFYGAEDPSSNEPASMTFLRCLNFPGSQLLPPKEMVPFKAGRTIGKMASLVAYLRPAADGKLFDTAVRVRTFLDLCRNNHKWLKSARHRRIVRIIANRLVDEIQKKKKELFGENEERVLKELTGLLSEIQTIVSQCDETLPQTPALQKIRGLSLIPKKARKEVDIAAATPSTPPLQAISPIPDPFSQLVPMEDFFDEKQPKDQLHRWADRCRQFEQKGEFSRLLYEAKRMADLLPGIELSFWGSLTAQQADQIAPGLEAIGRALAKASYQINRAAGWKKNILSEIQTASFKLIAIAHYLACRRNIPPGSDLATHAENGAADKTFVEPLAFLTQIAGCGVLSAIQAQTEKSEEHIGLEIFLRIQCNLSVDPDLALQGFKNYLKAKSASPTIENLIQQMGFLSIISQEGSKIKRLGDNPSMVFKPVYHYIHQWKLFNSFLFEMGPFKSKLRFFKTPSREHLTPEMQEIQSELLARRIVSSDNDNGFFLVDSQITDQSYQQMFFPQLTRRGYAREELRDLAFIQQTNQEKYHNPDNQEWVLGLSPDDLKTQVIHTFECFLKHPHLLERAEMQWLFFEKLFNSNPCAFDILLRLQKNRPAIIGFLKGLQNQMDVAKQSNQIRRGVACIKVLNRLKNHIGKIDDRLIDKLFSPASYMDQLFKLLEPQFHDKSAKGLEEMNEGLITLLSLYAEKIKKEPFFSRSDLERIGIAYTKLKANGGKETDEVDKVMAFALPLIESEVPTDAAFIQKIISGLDLPQAKHPWVLASEGFPLFETHTPQGLVYYNFLKGLFYDQRGQVDYLPAHVLKDHQVAKLFPDARKILWLVQGVVPKPGEMARLTVYTHPTLGQRIVLRESVPPPGANPQAANPSHLIIEREVALPNKRKEWLVYQEIRKLPDELETRIGQESCWVSRSKEWIATFNQNDTEPNLFISLTHDSKKKAMVHRQLIRPKAGPLLYLTPPQLESLTAIEPGGKIDLFGSGGKAVLIEYPFLRLNGAKLRYSLEKGGWQSPLFPGYQLAPYGKMVRGSALPETFTHYQLLECQGKQKVLVPFGKMTASEHSSSQRITGQEGRGTFETIFEEDNPERCLYEFDLNQETNRLECKSPDGFLYLAYLFLFHKDYDAAGYYLDKARTGICPLERFFDLFELIEGIADPTPNGLAFQCRVELLRHQMMQSKRIQRAQKGKKELFDQAKGARLMRFANLFKHYCSSESEADQTVRLSSSQKEQAAFLLNDHLKQLQADVKEMAVVHPASPLPPTPIVPLLGPQELAGINLETILLWGLSGSSKVLPPISKIGSGKWIVDHFPALIQKLSTLPVDSVKFRELVHAIRLVQMDGKPSSLLDKILDPRLTIGAARSILLSLSQARRKNPGTAPPRFTSFSRPFFTCMRMYRFYRVHQTIESIGSHGIKTVADLDTFEQSVQQPSQADPDPAARESQQLLVTLKKVRCRVEEKYRGSPIPDQDPAAFNAALFEVLLGQKAAASLQAFQALVDWLPKEIEPLEGLSATASGAPLSLESMMSSATSMLSSVGSLTSFAPSIGLGSLVSKILPEGAPSVDELAKMTPKNLATLADSVGISLPSVEREVKNVAELKAVVVEIGQNEQDQLRNSIAQLTAKIDEVKEEKSPLKIQTPPYLKKAVMGPLVIRLKKFFKKKAGQPKGVAIGVFKKGQTLSLAEERLSDEHEEDLRTYRQEVIESRYSISKAQAKKVSAALKMHHKQLLVKQQAGKEQLLQLAEIWDNQAARLRMRRITGQAVKPSINYLISLWRHGELQQLNALGGRQLSRGELGQLERLIVDYLLATTELNHVEKSIEAAECFIGSCTSSCKAGDPALSQQLYQLIATNREYGVVAQHQEMGAQQIARMAYAPPNEADARDLLSIEYFLGIILRPNQLETVRDMLFDPNLVTQLDMGGGKSKVLLPLLAKRKATGRNLVALLLPDSLYETNKSDLDATNRELFGQETFFLEFQRNSCPSETDLLLLYEKLLSIIQRRGFIATTKNSLLSYRNSFLDLAKQLKETPETKDPAVFQKKLAISRRMQIMAQTLQLFKNQMDVLADEVHTVLDVRKEMNFAIGDAEKVDQQIAKVGFELMQMVLQDPALAKVSQALLANTQQESLNEWDREAALKHLASNFYDRSPNLKLGDKAAFIKYATGEEIKSEESLPSFMQQLKDIHRLDYKRIAALKGFLTQGFAVSWTKAGRVDYGRDPRSMDDVIPYKAKDRASIGSVFDMLFERCSFILQDYFQTGVEFKPILKVINQFGKAALKECQGIDPDEAKGVNETAAGKAFAAWIKKIDPKGLSGASTDLSTYFGHEELIEDLVHKINSHPETRIAFCYCQVLKNLPLYAQQISSKSEDLADMVCCFGGFTGTPWNHNSYPDKIGTKKVLGIDGKSYALLLDRQVKIKTIPLSPKDPIGSLMKQGFARKYQALIDIGAYLKGTTNYEFIKKALERAQKAKVKVSSAVYFDEGNSIVRLKEVNGHSGRFKGALENELATQITLYDQEHTVGADIKQGRKAKAAVTIGPTTTTNSLFQGLWRLRQADQEQEFELWISQEVSEMITGQPGWDPTIEEVLVFCRIQEAGREATDNYRAEKEKIAGFGARQMFQQLVEISARGQEVDQVVELAAHYMPFLEKANQQEALLDQAASLGIKSNPIPALKAEKEIAVQKMKRVSEQLKDGLEEYGAKLLAAAQELQQRPSKDPGLLPEEVEAGGVSAGQEIEMVVEAELDIQIEAEIEIQTETQTETIAIKEQVIAQQVPKEAQFQNIQPITATDLKNLTNGQIDRLKFKRLNDTVGAFDEPIYITASYEKSILFTPKRDNYWQETEYKEVAESVFYTTRLPIQDACFIKTSSRWTVLIGTSHENRKVVDSFVQSQQETKGVHAAVITIANGRPIPICKTGDVSSAALPFKAEDIDSFWELYVQVKFFNGEMQYAAKAEKLALRRWLGRKGAVAMRNLFEKYILPCSSGCIQRQYPSSSLYRVFKELMKFKT